jgi:N-acetylglutamate synthase
MSVAPDRIRTLEELAFNAWPALQTLLVDGWVLRFADGYTKRANSANAWRPGEIAPARIRETVETVYRSRGLRPIFRLSPLAPAGMDPLLARNGYRTFDETSVLCAPISIAAATGDGVAIVEAVDAAWLDGYARATGLATSDRETLARMLRLVHLPCAFARIDSEGAPVAFGYGVRERGHVGIFDVVTAAAHRRRGLGTRIVGALMRWAAESGADQAYLQVVGGNAPALSLYGRLGFAEAYRYHYRLPPG